MVVRSSAAPPTPWSTSLTQPTPHEMASVQAFSNIAGDVRIGSNVWIAPGTSIRADKGSPFHIGSGTNIQDGVVIHGLAQGAVLGDDQNQYSVWIGNNTSITHKVLIHGPVYIGDECFVGFRSTVFNARLGKGSIVMMHALVQDVEIPPGRYVPSGSIITTQQQADRLPEVHPDDLKFARHVVGLTETLQPSHTSSRAISQDALTSSSVEQQASNYTPYGSSGVNYTPYNPSGSGSHHQESNNQESTQESTMRLSTEILQQVRQLLAGGYRIGTEHIDQRRFRTNSWKSCQPIQSSRESEVVSALEACLQEHSGEYVRLFGIGNGRQRVGEVIVQRPGDSNGAGTSTATANSYRPSHPVNNTNGHAPSIGGASADLQQQVQQLLNQGYHIATEYANTRQYKANAWKGGPAIHTNRVGEAMATLQSFLAEHSGEYVRLIAVDPKAKKRASETVIQTPNGPANSTGNGVRSMASAPSGGGSVKTSGGSADLQQQVQQLLNQGYHLATEYANARQYKANAWKGGPSIHTNRVGEAMATLQSFLAEHPGEYVRLIAVDPKAKKRASETVIQTPSGQPTSNGKVSASSTASGSSSFGSSATYSAPVSGSRLAAEALEQIRQLLAQGHKISTEYANPRQYKANAWKGGVTIQANREPEVISSLESFLSEHNSEYVRLIGIEPKAKRRVMELVIHQPKR